MAHNIGALGAKVEALRAEIVELDAVEAPSEEQASRFDAALSEFDSAKAEFDAAVERAAKVEAVRSAAVEVPEKVERGFSAPAVHVQRDAFDGVERVAYMPREEQTERALRAVEQVATRRTPSEHVEEITRKIEEIPGVAAHVLLTGSDAYRSAFDEYLRSQGRPNYTNAEAEAVRASLSLTGANGGYNLPFLLDPTLIHTGTATKNPIRRIARVVQGTQNVWHGVSVGNVTTYWLAENTALTDGTPTFAQPVVTASTLTAYVTASSGVLTPSAPLNRPPAGVPAAMNGP